MRELKNVSLVIIDDIKLGRAENAILRCIEDIKFGDILFFTNFESKLFPTIKINPIKNKEDYSRFIIKELYKYVKTDYVLIVQWDGYILHPEIWTDDFLNYDYIGARWVQYPDDDKYLVGNGGFSLRSKKLLKIIALDDIIYETYPEDDMICRKYRDYLERKYDIRFAPVSLANIFSDENSYFHWFTFGYHGGVR